MPAISIFDIFKIGIGPSSSHTLGPWIAANDFAGHLETEFDGVKVHLFGSLSKTGKGHATDTAIIMGLQGFNPKTIDPELIPINLHEVSNSKTLNVKGNMINFYPGMDIIFRDETHEMHPNTLIFKAFYKGKLVTEQTYASVGGGFIEKEGEHSTESDSVKLPYPIENGGDIINYTDKNQCNISDIVHQNELYFQTETDIVVKLDRLLQTFKDSIYRGCTTDGILPGGLNVKRRAKSICENLIGHNDYSDFESWIDAVRNTKKDFSRINRWISCFALAVNEENASLGRIVTSPTNGASGVIPAVLMYYLLFCDNNGMKDCRQFLYTAGEVGCLFKKGATISAAVGGCQAEIGVSSAMAAAALTEVKGGSARQALMAAEIAMEHHLGLTCDPIGGLVQIPCIERNAMGAIKAITASNLALSSDPDHAKVHIDTVIQTMWMTAKDMNTKYKETSEGGLAIQLPVILPNC
ncbi:MAG: L-serine ammonia-lyase [Bacteroidia bacterium]|nr:L-serine ammonia-lyase [Bacteroidia bacterium]